MPGQIAVPGQVSVSMAEIAESARGGLLALAVGTGLQVMVAMFDEDVTRLCGPEAGTMPAVRGTDMAPGGSVTSGGPCQPGGARPPGRS
jgi:hypothetical protein